MSEDECVQVVGPAEVTAARFDRLAAGVDVVVLVGLYCLLMGLESSVWWGIYWSWPTAGNVRAAALSRPILAIATGVFAFLLARWRRLPVEYFGVRCIDPASQVLAGAFVAIGSFIAYWLLVALVMCAQFAVRLSGLAFAGTLGASDLGPAVAAEQDHALVIWLCFWGAIWEELLFRSLLYTRVQTAVGSVHLAVVITIVLFALSHSAEGWSVVVGVLPLSTVLGYAFARTRSLLAVVTGHFLYNCLMYAQFQ